MASMPGPCGPQFEDWEDAYDDWEDADAAANKALKNVGVSTGVAIAGCLLLPLVGCILGGVNALNNDYDSIQATNARYEAEKELNKARKAWLDCVQNHKEYYKFILPFA